MIEFKENRVPFNNSFWIIIYHCLYCITYPFLNRLYSIFQEKIPSEIIM